MTMKKLIVIHLKMLTVTTLEAEEQDELKEQIRKELLREELLREELLREE